MTRKEKQEQAHKEKLNRYHTLCSKMETDGYNFACNYNGSGNASTYSTKIKNAYKAITGKSL